MMKEFFIKSSYILIVGLFGFKCFDNMSEGLKSNNKYLSFEKEKKKPRVIKTFNTIENVPISLEDFKIKYDIKISKRLPVNTIPKADTIVRVPIVEHIIEPKKIAEPVELPEPAVIKIDTTKIKSKIRVSRE